MSSRCTCSLFLVRVIGVLPLSMSLLFCFFLSLAVRVNSPHICFEILWLDMRTLMLYSWEWEWQYRSI